MKKLLKFIAKTLVVLIVLVILLLLLNPLWVGQTAGMIANAVVPGMTGTDFNVDKIRVNLYTGTIRVEKLRLANPKGYDAEDAVSLDKLSVKLSTMSLFSSTIKIQDITIENPYVSYLDENGTNNFEAIAANVKAGKEDDKSKEAKPEEAKDGGKKVVIDRLSIAGTRVRYGMITLPVLDIVLSGLGASEGGVTIDNVGLEIWEKIKSSFTSAGSAVGGALQSLGGNVTDMIGNSGDGAKKAAETVSDGAKKAAESVSDGAKKAAETVSDGAKKAVDSVSDGAKKATEALGNLLK